MTRRRPIATTAVCLLLSAAAHAAWLAGSWWIIPTFAVRTSAETHIAPVILPDRTDREVFASGGVGDAVFDALSSVDQNAREAPTEQPRLDAVTAAGSPLDTPSPASLQQEAVPLPPAKSVDLLAEGLAPPPAPPATVSLDDDTADAAETRSPEAPSASPAVPADRDSDAFSKEPEITLDLRSGRTVARAGIDFKLTGFNPSLAAFMSARFIGAGTRFQVRVTVDDAGTPLDVEVLHGTGSGQVDRELRNKLFNSTFEYEPDTPFEFTIRFR